MDSWNDVRFVLALSRSGSIRKAAIQLNVNHTTVSRRIEALEKHLSAKLFEKTPSGYVLTAAGKVISKAGEQIEDLVVSSERRIEGSDIELTGEVHIHIPDIFDAIVCEALAPFSQQHPKLTIKLSCSTDVADMSRREADIAIRFSEAPPEDMVGRILCRIPIALYASADYEIDAKKSWSDYPWVRWAIGKQSKVEQLADRMSGKDATMAVTTYHTLNNLIRDGAGIGFLVPCFADKDTKLKRICFEENDVLLDIWMLIHPDLRGVRRIKEITALLQASFEDKGCRA